jgi:hypothetical protein
MKPACTRCVLGLQKCNYPSSPSAANDQGRLSLPSPPCSIQSPYSNAPSHSEFALPCQISTPLFVEPELGIDGAESCLPLSDADLYHHYLQHTSRSLTYCQRDQGALQIGMPTLALQSKTVFHSLLALSAACICCDMISREPAPDPGAVSQILATGYRHYTLANERMIELMSGEGELKPEPLLASTILLVPFASASQQINHWLSSRSGPQEHHKLLSSTPRDVIVIMRGVRSMLQAMEYEGMSRNTQTTQVADFATESASWLLDSGISPPILPPSQTHVMFPILAATSKAALSKLQERLALASYDRPSSEQVFSGDSISACWAAFEILSSIATSTFHPPKESESASPSNTVEIPFEAGEVPPPQVAPWLRDYASRPAIPLPGEPLTRSFLTFLVQAPQAYLDLVLPLLDQRLESPISDGNQVELTKEQALALDIYAHWSVLMFLAEDESWWIGKLPTVTLTGMLNRYGDDFVARLWPEYGLEKAQWWPASMLNILQEVKRCG